jgi:hypothetical protein
VSFLKKKEKNEGKKSNIITNINTNEKWKKNKIKKKSIF